jgi:hypothetical protein
MVYLSFGTYVLLVDIKALHIDYINSLSSWLFSHNVSNKTYRKYDGHAWSKVITTNIENNFGFGSKKVQCLGHLCCVHINYDCFIHFGVRNETP